MSGALQGYKISGQVPHRHGTGSPIIVPYQAFETADKPIVIAAGNDRLFVKFAEVIGKPEWVTDPRFENGRKRAEVRLELVALIEPIIHARPRAHWIALFGKAGVPCAPVNDIADLADSEQLAAMDMMRTLPGTGMQVVGLPINFDRQRPVPRRDSPKLGEHNREIFGE